MKQKPNIKDKPSILIVEDNPVNQLLMMKKFEQQGFRSLLLAKNGQEAIDLALKNKPDLILMDIQLPDMNGNAAIQSLRNQEFTGPIVAVSADSMKEDMDKSFAAGASGYITKPINFAVFFSQINGFLKSEVGQKKTPGVKPKEDKNSAADSQANKINQSISDAAKNVFIMDAKEKLQIIAEVLEHADSKDQMERIKAIAHEYKGSAEYFGLHELASVAKELDMGFKSGENPEFLIKLTRQLVVIIKGIINESA
jgi:CheY-like chemotaxis protein